METDEEVAWSPDDSELPFLRGDVFGLRDFQAIEEAKKLLNTGNFEGRTNPLIYANQRQTICVSLVSDIDRDKSTNSCRVNVGHLCKVEDQIMRPVLAHFGLEFSQRG